MPPIISCEKITNGFRIVTTARGTIQVTRNNIPAAIRNTNDIAQYETWINNFIDSVLSFTDGDGNPAHHFYAKVHVIAANPLDVIVRCSWFPIPDNFTVVDP